MSPLEDILVALLVALRLLIRGALIGLFLWLVLG